MLVENLAKLSMEEAVHFAATWLARLEHPSASHLDVDISFITSHLAGSARTAALHHVQHPRQPGLRPERTLIVPQALTLLMVLALRHNVPAGPITGPFDEKPAVIVTLGIPGHLGNRVTPPPNDIITIDEPSELVGELVANQAYNSHQDLRGALATFQRCWRELPIELAQHPQMVDLPAEYADATGLPLDDMVTVCSALWASAANGTCTVELSYFDNLGWDRERIDAVLGLVAATPEQMRQMLDDEARDYGDTWSRRTFREYPVVRWPNHLTVLSPHWLVERCTGLWPLFEIRRYFTDRGENARAGRATNAFTLAMETWVLEAFSNIVGDTSRYYSEDDLRAAYGKKSKVCDAALEYPGAWVVVEVTITGLNAHSAAGVDQTAIVKDIEGAVKKVRQLDAAIVNIRADETKVTGRPAVVGRKFHPVLVVASSFPVNPATMVMLRQRFESENLLQGADVAPLEIMEADDVDIAEGAIEAGGPDLAQLLQGKASSALANMSMQHYVVSNLPHLNRLPRRVTGRWDAWFSSALDALRSNAA
ncbi:MAG: hypothetical protein QM714_08470 [Nocardioides sp.]|uniref:hypothetical protein n=1 Tax=Nocardioides sp. TaxID=35761 RepID=UPI0039E5D812